VVRANDLRPAITKARVRYEASPYGSEVDKFSAFGFSPVSVVFAEFYAHVTVTYHRRRTRSGIDSKLKVLRAEIQLCFVRAS
jgi:hypothetical protein